MSRVDENGFPPDDTHESAYAGRNPKTHVLINGEPIQTHPLVVSHVAKM